MADPQVLALRDRLDSSLRKERFSDARNVYAELEAIDAGEPRWPHRHGELLLRLGRDGGPGATSEALHCFERAVDPTVLDSLASLDGADVLPPSEPLKVCGRLPPIGVVAVSARQVLSSTGD